MKRFGYIYAPRVKGNLNLGPGAWLAAPGGIIGAFNTSGDVYFVDWFKGDDGYDGSLPELEVGTIHGPLKRVVTALGLCTDDNDDYIIVMDAWGEATPVAINKTRVHIIGLSANPSRLYPVWPVNDVTNDTAILTISSPSNLCEIAGLDLGGGPNHAAIENVAGTPMGVYIHHCVFGSNWTGDTPQDGIRIALNATALRIEACKFLGGGGGGPGTLLRDGVHFAAAADSHGGDIVDNIFQGVPTVAINMLSHGEGMVIERNRIALDALTQGAGITLGAAVAGCLLAGNRAGFGGNSGAFNAGVNLPFLDNNMGNNHWVENYIGNALSDPD